MLVHVQIGSEDAAFRSSQVTTLVDAMQLLSTQVLASVRLVMMSRFCLPIRTAECVHWVHHWAGCTLGCKTQEAVCSC